MTAVAERGGQRFRILDEEGRPQGELPDRENS